MPSHLLLTLLIISLYSLPTLQFQCMTCNANSGDNDASDCLETVEECAEGIESCSMVTYTNKHDDKVHVRKFCTSPGTPIYQYLLFFPGSALCQNIETVSKYCQCKIGSSKPNTVNYSNF